METPSPTFWHIRDGQPPHLAAYIGATVKRVWRSDSRKLLIVLLDTMKMMKVQYFQPSGISPSGVEIMVGTLNLPFDYDAFDRVMPQTTYTEELRGQKFLGLDSNVVMFGRFGAEVTPDGINWVMLAQ